MAKDRARGSAIGRGADILAPVSAPPAGLCDACRHQRVVGNTRGSRFSLCERSRTDESYPRYPRVPVRECEGFEPREAKA